MFQSPQAHQAQRQQTPATNSSIQTLDRVAWSDLEHAFKGDIHSDIFNEPLVVPAGKSVFNNSTAFYSVVTARGRVSKPSQRLLAGAESH